MNYLVTLEGFDCIERRFDDSVAWDRNGRVVNRTTYQADRMHAIDLTG